MTVIFSKRCELAIQAVLYLSIQDNDKYYNSGEISKDLHVPKEFVSKILQTLTHSNIVGSKKGKTGGFFLSKKSSEITLLDIVKSIDGIHIFNQCVLGFSDCDPSNPCPIHNQWEPIRDEIYEMLKSQTLDELKQFTKNKINNIRNLFKENN